MEDSGSDLNLKPCASGESAAVTESSSSQSTASHSTEGDQFADHAIPAARFTAYQRAYAKDDVTGLLYPAVVRKSIWGPADTSSAAFCSSLVPANKANNDADREQQQPDEKDDDDDDSEGWCHHHFVHYMGKIEVISLRNENGTPT